MCAENAPYFIDINDFLRECPDVMEFRKDSKSRVLSRIESRIISNNACKAGSGVWLSMDKVEESEKHGLYLKNLNDSAMKLERELDKEIKHIYNQLKKKKQLVFSHPQSVKNYNEFLANKPAVISVVSAGLPYELFNLIRKQIPFEENYWIKVLDLSAKSLKHYQKQKKTFSSIQSEKIIRASELTHRWG